PGNAIVRPEADARARRSRLRSPDRRQLPLNELEGQAMASVAFSKNSTIVRKFIELSALRAGFALGSRFAPRRTVDRAARLFATPAASGRKRARAARPDAEMRRESLQVRGETIAMYVWGNPAAQPYALLAHGWSSFGLRFLSWVAKLRALGYAVVT